MASKYTISVSDSAIQRLHRKLDAIDFPDELDDAGWDYGCSLKDVKRLADRWRNDYDWRQHEKQLNDLPNYHAKIDVDGFGSYDIHFLHQESNISGAIPLLFCHGWPGSFIEVTKLLPFLKGGSTDGTPAFHVVAPSLPNFGFSEGVKKKGFGLAQYAEVCHKVMLKLGYDQYVTQGGDWGFMITRIMGLRYPQHVKGSHINMARSKPPTLLSNPIAAVQHAVTPYSDFEKQGFERTQWYNDVSEGYRKQQSTKPQTLGYALADSPVGLLAWIYEKLVEWTDSYPWTDDEILTWVSIYWFSTAGPAANLRIYYEATHDGPEFNRNRTHEWIPDVKLGVALFPKELSLVPKTWLQTMGPLVHTSQWNKGGHFAAHERPDAIVSDLRDMFGKGGQCFGLIDGRGGF